MPRPSAALAVVGLRERARHRRAGLSHGERRELEIAMALATAPTVLLLDEPLAGMGPEESAHIVALLKRLAADHAILLVEHDMDAVFALADRLTVMVNGRCWRAARRRRSAPTPRCSAPISAPKRSTRD